jgi:23S rRNA U2552 (ribose-2'-O)-methylase RlmE/FtsJ
MPQLDFDGANSKVSADKIQGQSGTSVTVPTGHTLAGTDANSITINGVNAVAVAPSTSGNVLTSNGSAWTSAAAAGGGLLLAVASVTKTDVYSSAATTWTDIPDLVITITPTTSGNKFLITAHLNGANSTNGAAHKFRLTVDGTAVGIGDAGGSSRVRVNIQDMIPNVSDAMASSSCQFLYTTTGGSAHSIKVQHLVAGGTLVLNRTQGDNADTAYYGRSSSTLTVMEIDV